MRCLAFAGWWALAALFSIETSSAQTQGWSCEPLAALNSADDELLLGWDGNSLYFRRIARSTTATKDSNWFLESGVEFSSDRLSGWTEFDEPQAMQLRAWSSRNWPGLGAIQHVAIDPQRDAMVVSAQTARGDFDLYLSQRMDGDWSVPIPLNELNSPQDELFPNFDHGDILFASNGWGGLGGFDVWRASRQQQYAVVESLEGGVNSAGDELCAVAAGTGPEQGYYVSAVRMGGSGVDVWHCTGQQGALAQGRHELALEFRFRREPLSGLEVQIRERGGATLVRVNADERGRALIGAIELDAAVEVVVEAKGMASIPDGTVCHVFERCVSGGCESGHWPGWRRVRSYRMEGGKAFVFDLLPLDPLARWPRPSDLDGTSWPAEARVWRTYFTSSSFALSVDVQQELCAWLHEIGWHEQALGYVQVVGFTDARGSVERNRNLSDLRAAAAAEALKSCGLPLELIQWEGRGEDPSSAPDDKARRVEIVWHPQVR